MFKYIMLMFKYIMPIHDAALPHTLRTQVSDDPVAYDPERAMCEVTYHTHHLPRHWRGRAHTSEVRFLTAAHDECWQQVLVKLGDVADIHGFTDPFSWHQRYLSHATCL